jgi:hypothetical protein
MNDAAMSPVTRILHKWLHKAHAHPAPFDSLRHTRQWVDQLQHQHEYEAHQMLVDALNQFNLSRAPLDANRLHILHLLEQTGGPLQASMVMQYMKNQSAFRYAGKSLWQEIFAFYWQLALAYQSLVKTATHTTPALAQHLPLITQRALHYQGKLMQWRYMHYESPSADAWRNVHTLFNIAENNKFAATRLPLGTEQHASCTQLYLGIQLLSLINPVGLCPWKIERTAHWVNDWSQRTRLIAEFDAHTHTHWLDLTGAEPPHRTTDRPVEGSKLRYWSLHEVLAALEHTRGELAQTDVHAMLKEVSELHCLLDDITVILKRGGAQRQVPRHEHSVSAGLVCGYANVLDKLETPTPMAAQAQWILQDEGDSGYGLTQYAATTVVPAEGALVHLSVDIKGHAAELAVVRWIEQIEGHPIKLGVEKLGTRPRLVTLQAVQHLMSDSLFNGKCSESTAARCIFLSSANERRLSASLLVNRDDIQPARVFDMLDGDYIYRIRIAREIERNGDWARLKFDVLTRQNLRRTRQADDQIAV